MTPADREAQPEPLVPSGQTEPEAANDPAIDAGALRRASLRAVVAGAVGSLGALAYGQASFGGGDRIYLAVIGATGGLVVLPAALAEVLTERWPRAWTRSLLFAALVWLLATVATYLGYVQAHYTVAVVGGSDNAFALRQALEVLRETTAEPDYSATMFSGIAVAFAAVALLRRRRWAVWQQVLGALAATLTLSGLLLIWSGVLSRGDGEFSFFMTLLGALTLPPIYWLSDWVERRWWSADPTAQDPRQAGTVP